MTKKGKSWSAAERLRQTPVKHHVKAWGAPGASEASPGDDSIDKVVDRIFADCLGFLFVHCFTPEGCSLDVAQRRFLALVYIYRPDLINARTVAQIADEVNVTKGAIGQHLSAMRREIGATGINSMKANARRRVRAGQIVARLRKKPPRGGGAES